MAWLAIAIWFHSISLPIRWRSGDPNYLFFVFLTHRLWHWNGGTAKTSVRFVWILHCSAKLQQWRLGCHSRWHLRSQSIFSLSLYFSFSFFHFWIMFTFSLIKKILCILKSLIVGFSLYHNHYYYYVFFFFYQLKENRKNRVCLRNFQYNSVFYANRFA